MVVELFIFDQWLQFVRTEFKILDIFVFLDFKCLNEQLTALNLAALGADQRKQAIARYALVFFVANDQVLESDHFYVDSKWLFFGGVVRDPLDLELLEFES